MEGNQQKLREAVVSLLDALDSLGCDEATAAIAMRVPDMAESGEKCLDAIRKAKAALSAPARQCDVGTAEEQNRRFDNFCRGMEKCKTCPCNVMPRCHMVWAQTPYTEEGGY